MDDFIGIVIFIIICFVIITRTKAKGGTASKKQASVKSSSTRAIANQSSVKKSSTVTKSVPAKVVTAKKDVASAQVNHNMLADDRANDWLAKQLRDEHIAFKNTKDMFDLKIEHASHCDAKYIRDFHHRECDATKIDTASGK